MRSLAVIALAAASSSTVTTPTAAQAASPSDPSVPDYYDAVRLDEAGFDAEIPDGDMGSNMIRFTSTWGDGDGNGASYRLADVTALLPYTFGSSGSSTAASSNGLMGGGDGEEGEVATASDAVVRPRSSVQDHAAALLLACHHFNNGMIADVLGPIENDVLAKAYESTDVRLTASLYDTQFSPIESTRLLTKVLDGSPTRDKPLPQAILGAYRSACTSPTAILSGVNGIPQISYHSSGTDFDNKEQYPYFGRTVPSSGADARAVVDYLKTLGVTYLGVIFVTDAFGSAYQKSLQDAAGEADPPIRTDSVSFSYKSASGGSNGYFSVDVSPNGEPSSGGGQGGQEIRNAIQSLKNTEYRYFVAIVGEEHYSRVMAEAAEQGIAGGEYVWLFTGGVDRRTFQDRIARYQKDDNLAVSTKGIGLIQVEGGQTSDVDYANPSQRVGTPPPADADTGYQRFRAAWRSAMSDSSLVQYFRSKQLEIDPPVGGHDFTTIEFSPDPSQHAYFVYDAIVSLGLSMSYSTAVGGANGTGLDFPTGKDIYDSLRQNVTFEGASGTVKIDPNSGTRVRESVTYTVWNAREVELEGEEEGDKVGFDLVPTSHYVARKGTEADIVQEASKETMEASAAALADAGEVAEELDVPEFVTEWIPVEGDDRQFVYADGTTVAPAQLPAVDEQMNHIGKSGRIAGLVLMGIVVLIALLAMGWTAVQRRSRVVRASRPLFLAFVSVGCLIMASAIIPLSQEETTTGGDKARLDAACMAAPWLYVIGFAIAFSALFTKTWTLNKVYRNPDVDCVVVTWKDLVRTLGALLVINVALLLSWTLVSPLEWERFDKDSKDQFDRTTETYATCTSEKSLPFVIVIIVVNLGALLVANFQAYQARDIQTEYQESRYVAISMASILQAWCMGIPIMIVVKDAPQAKFFVEAGIIFVTCTAVLLLVFTPKLLAVRSDRRKEEEERRRNRLRDVNARAGRGQFDDEEDENGGIDLSGHHNDKKEQFPNDNIDKDEDDILNKDKLDAADDMNGGEGGDEENPQGGSFKGGGAAVPQDSSAQATYGGGNTTIGTASSPDDALSGADEFRTEEEEGTPDAAEETRPSGESPAEESSPEGIKDAENLVGSNGTA
mmetsp:Transcript_35922/g.66177  ORF Transcript_35922/g.66177 Transcript_35922/m.66177 type:complete len:1120 (-) Transcript_35922:228-3587(-)